MDLQLIIKQIDRYLTKSGRSSIDPVEANEILEKVGLLRNSKNRPGKPLRDLLRKGLIPHAFQIGGKGSKWTIPHSKNSRTKDLSYLNTSGKIVLPKNKNLTKQQTNIINFKEILKNIEKARQKYQPEIVKYLLVAEAPPDSLERFFYFEDVKQHDYLFLGITQALYPDLKDKFLKNKRSTEIKKLILEQFKNDGFFLLDLSDLPLSLLEEPLKNQLPNLKKKVEKVVNKQTKIILIKVNVYDIAYSYLLKQGFKNVINLRIPFPGQGGQKKFQIEFNKALKSIGYNKL